MQTRRMCRWNFWDAGVDTREPDRPTQRSIVGHGVRPRAGGQSKSAIEQAVPDRRGHAMVTEAQHFDVIDFAQCRVDGQFERFIEGFRVRECRVA